MAARAPHPPAAWVRLEPLMPTMLPAMQPATAVLKTVSSPIAHLVLPNRAKKDAGEVASEQAMCQWDMTRGGGEI